MTVDMLSAQVSVVSYDLAVRMAGVLKECSFQLVIAVSGQALGAGWGGVGQEGVGWGGVGQDGVGLGRKGWDGVGWGGVGQEGVGWGGAGQKGSGWVAVVDMEPRQHVHY